MFILRALQIQNRSHLLVILLYFSMQKFLLANLIIIAGFSLSLVYSVLLFGINNTYQSVSVLGGRAVSLIFPVELYSHNESYRESIVDTFHQNSQDFNIKGQTDYKDDELLPPLSVPTKGIAGHRNFLYLPEIHPGIDIWTNADGSGLENKAQGYPVYAACGGYVFHYKPPNEEIEIKCDPIADHYRDKVPSLNIKILYSHLGDGETGESFHNLKVGQRVEKGELVGYQGNKSSFAPENKVVHLHFGIYDLSARQNPPPPLDPMLYIGVNTHKVGQLFYTVHD